MPSKLYVYDLRWFLSNLDAEILRTGPSDSWMQAGCEYNVQGAQVGAVSVLHRVRAPTGAPTFRSHSGINIRKGIEEVFLYDFGSFVECNTKMRLKFYVLLWSKFGFMLKQRFVLQHKKVLEKVLPENLKITIAQRIENHLFSKVGPLCRILNLI